MRKIQKKTGVPVKGKIITALCTVPFYRTKEYYVSYYRNVTKHEINEKDEHFYTHQQIKQYFKNECLKLRAKKSGRYWNCKRYNKFAKHKNEYPYKIRKTNRIKVFRSFLKVLKTL